MPRHIKISLIVLCIGLGVALGFFVDVVGRIQSMMKNERETEEFKPPAQTLYAPTDPPISIKLFFPTSGGVTILAAEDATIYKSGELTNRAKQILAKLQDGPKSGALVTPWPKDVKVQDLFISDQGTAYIDF